MDSSDNKQGSLPQSAPGVDISPDDAAQRTHDGEQSSDPAPNGSDDSAGPAVSVTDSGVPLLDPPCYVLLHSLSKR